LAIDKELEAKILRYHLVEKWKVGTISRQLGVHHDAVERVLPQVGLPKVERADRPVMIDPYLPFIMETLKQYPTLTASRLYAMVRERGYEGGPDHFRHQVACYRPLPQPEAFQRLKTLPGEQSQIDWGHFGNITIGRAQHKLMAFVLVLSYSLRIFLRFYLNAQMANFLRGHETAFTLSTFHPLSACIRFKFHPIHTKLHSLWTESKPRSRNCLNPRTCLMMPKTVSTVDLPVA